MKQSFVRAFTRAARLLAIAAVGPALGAGTLLAQGSTGKIEGRVRDQAGAPIANAQVFIVGTAFNALTNPQGYYFMNNVPASTVSVRAAFIGYKSTQVDGVRVLADQTITVDIQLEQTAVEIQEITVVSQTQPLVPRDEVTTKQRLDGEVVKNLPVDALNQVLALQPGVVASRSTNQLSIRGGRIDQNATYIDGVPVQSGYRGTSQSGTFQSAFRGPSTQVEVSSDAFEQAVGRREAGDFGARRFEHRPQQPERFFFVIQSDHADAAQVAETMERLHPFGSRMLPRHLGGLRLHAHQRQTDAEGRALLFAV